MVLLNAYGGHKSVRQQADANFVLLLNFCFSSEVHCAHCLLCLIAVQVFERLKPDLQTSDECIPCYKGHPFTIEGKGICRVEKLARCQIK